MLKRRNKKVKKITKEVKVNFSNNCIIKNKTATKVFKFKDITGLQNFLNNIEPNIRMKILINYKANTFYIFQTGDLQKKKKGVVVELKENQLNTIEIATLYKTFYSNTKFDNSNKNIKHEIAPQEFIINNDYIKVDSRYANIISIEHIDSSCDFKDILKDLDTWLIIDCYKMNNNFILDKLDEMDKDNVLDKKFSPTVLSKINKAIEMLENEVIFQCELKLLSYSNRLKQLEVDSENIKDILYNNYSAFYIASEKLNTRKAFEKSIYPNNKMDIINSINLNNLVSLIGGAVNV